MTYQPLTPSNVTDDVIGTIQQWMLSYTDANEEGVQYKVSELAQKDNTLVVKYEVTSAGGMGVFYPTQYFEITIQVQELKDDT